MRALIPVLSSLGTVAGAFVASFLATKRRQQLKDARPESKSKAITRIVVASVFTLTCAVVTVMLVFSISDFNA